MAEKYIELKLMHCKDLKSFNFFQKLNVYAVVSIVEDGEDGDERKKKQEQRTPADNEGDGNPEWNHLMRFDLGSIDENDLSRTFLHFDLRSDGGILVSALGGERCVGQVWVPLKDVLLSPPGFVNYEVRTIDGKSNGVINFCINVKQQQQQNPNLPSINLQPHPQNPYYPPPISSPGYPSYPATPSTEYYYDAVTSPATSYSPQQSYYQYPPSPQFHHQQHQFSPLRPYPPPPHENLQPDWTQQPYPPPPVAGGWPLHYPPPADDHFSPHAWNSR